MIPVRWQKSDGVVVREKERDMTAEDIRRNWDRIGDFTKHSYPGSIGESNARIYQALQEIDEKPVTRSRLTKNNLSGIESVRILKLCTAVPVSHQSNTVLVNFNLISQFCVFISAKSHRFQVSGRRIQL